MITSAFLTGGSGFLGRALITMLRARGTEVVALARSDDAAQAVRAAGATPVRGDLTDTAALRAGMTGCDVVFHAAAKVNDWGARADFQRDTIDGTRLVVDAARETGVRRFVHVSTEAVLVGKGVPRIRNADETWPLPRRPLGLYPWSKGRAEDIVRAANVASGSANAASASVPGLETVIVRPRFIWGVGDTVLLPKIARLVRANKFAWIGGGSYLTSTAHVQNVCHGLVLAAERGVAGETYFITDGEPVEFRGFLTAMLATAGITPTPKSVPHWAARLGAYLGELAWRLAALGGEPPVTRTGVRLIGEEVTVSDAKARRELGYAPLVTREQGLAAMRAAAAASAASAGNGAPASLAGASLARP